MPAKVKVTQSCLTVTPLEFSRPEYWSGEPFPSPGDLPKPAIEPRSPALQADSLPAEPQGKPDTGILIYTSTALCKCTAQSSEPSEVGLITLIL